MVCPASRFKYSPVVLLMSPGLGGRNLCSLPIGTGPEKVVPSPNLPAGMIRSSRISRQRTRRTGRPLPFVTRQDPDLLSFSLYTSLASASAPVIGFGSLTGQGTRLICSAWSRCRAFSRSASSRSWPSSRLSRFCLRLMSSSMISCCWRSWDKAIQPATAATTTRSQVGMSPQFGGRCHGSPKISRPARKPPSAHPMPKRTTRLSLSHDRSPWDSTREDYRSLCLGVRERRAARHARCRALGASVRTVRDDDLRCAVRPGAPLSAASRALYPAVVADDGSRRVRKRP